MTQCGFRGSQKIPVQNVGGLGRPRFHQDCAWRQHDSEAPQQRHRRLHHQWRSCHGRSQRTDRGSHYLKACLRAYVFHRLNYCTNLFAIFHRYLVVLCDWQNLRIRKILV